MKRLIALLMLVTMLILGRGRAQNPSFKSFDPTQFSTNNFTIRILAEAFGGTSFLGTVYITNLYVTNLFSQFFYTSNEFVTNLYVTNLYAITSITTNLTVQNLISQFFVSSNVVAGNIQGPTNTLAMFGPDNFSLEGSIVRQPDTNTITFNAGATNVGVLIFGPYTNQLSTDGSNPTWNGVPIAAGIAGFGNPTHTIDGSVHNGTSTNAMRSDAAPALSTLGTAGTYGDATHFPVVTTDANGRVSAVTTSQSAGGITGLSNPSGLIGLSAVNGVATTADRSDSTHAIDQSIAPTWTGTHRFNNPIQLGGITNVLFNSSTDLEYTNGAANVIFSIANGSAKTVSLENQGGAAVVLVSDATQSVILRSGAQQVALTAGASFQPVSDVGESLGTINGPRWNGAAIASPLYVSGFLGSPTTNYSRLSISHSGSDAIYDSQANGSGTFATQTFSVGATNVIRFDSNAGASTTGILVYENGSSKRVTIGAADSGGAGFRVLRIPN